MRKLLWALVCSLIISPAVMAGDKNAAEEMIRHTLDEVILVLEAKDLSQEDKTARITEIITPMFAFSQMAKLTLGKKYWPGLSKEKKERFTELFVKRLKDSYSKKLMLYTNEKVVYDKSVQVDKKLQIQTHLVSDNNNISMIYKLYKLKDTWKIYDIEIQGVSIIQSYRSQFSYILQNGTIEDIFSKLEEQPVDS